MAVRSTVIPVNPVRRLVAVLCAVAVAVSVPAAAAADPPVRLAAQVTDTAGVLGPGRSQVDAALTRLRTEAGIRLYVVFVQSFDGVARQQWADRTARLSGFGARDYLLGVAVADRSYTVSIGSDERVGRGAREAVVRNDIDPALNRGDWAGAAVAAADGYRAAVTGSGGAGGWWIAALLVVAGGGLVWSLFRRRRSGPPVSPSAVSLWSGLRAGPIPAGVRLGSAPVPDDVGGMLLDLDDRVRGAPGDETAAAAAADLREAFRRYRLDPADPRVVDECRAAEGRLATEGRPATEGQPATEGRSAGGWVVDPAAAAGWDAAERTAWARAVLPGALAETRGLIGAADPVVSARRDARARAALSEARRYLGRAGALAGLDPVDAVAEVRQAHELAAAAAGG